MPPTLLPKLNLLWSYAHVRAKRRPVALLEELAGVSRFLLDSGAFTDFAQRKKVATQGGSYRPIELAEYIAFCRRHGPRLFQYIALDVIRDPAATARNLRTMLDAGLRPMPVFQMGERFERMAELVEVNPWVCVAGGVGSPAEFIHPRYRRAFAASGGKARIHGLGFTRYPEFLTLPLASGDSATWCSGQMYGSLFVFDKFDGVTQLKREDLHKNVKSPRIQSFLGFARKCGITYEQLCDPRSYGGTSFTIPFAFSIFAHVRMHILAAARGFKLFLAFASDANIQGLAAVLATSEGYARFDYAASAAEFARLGALRTADFGAYTRSVCETIKAHSDWQSPNHDSEAAA